MNRAFLAYVAGIVLVALMLVATVPAGAFAYLITRSAPVPAYQWVLLSPLLYLAWLATFLRISAAICHRLGARHPKPRYLVLGPGSGGGSSDGPGMITAGVCYRMYALMYSIPFISLFAQLPYFKTLVLRAYAPSVHVHDSAVVMGRLLDPDLTHVGAQAVIGGNSAIVAHSMAFRSTGERVFLSAPITIGDRATVGGESLVALGCVLGADAILEPGSVVEPFTHIPAGEVWGGNPARFKRGRYDRGSSLEAQAAAGSPGTAAGRPDAFRQLVIDALGLTPDDTPEILSADTCARWDSLGQVAIAAAIFDRYGVTVDARRVFRLTSVSDVAEAVANRPLASPAAPARPSAAGDRDTRTEPRQADAGEAAALPDDIEMLPLLDTQLATRRLAAGTDAPPRGATPLHLTITASFTAQAIEPSLKLWGRAFGFDIDCHFAGYDQIVQTLLGATGRSAAGGHAVTLVLTRLEDVATGSRATAEAQMDQLLDAVRQAASRPSSGGRLLVGTLPPVVSSVATLDRGQTEALRHLWRSRLEAVAGVELFEFGDVVERVGIDQAGSPQSEVLARAPYSPRLHQELAVALVRQLRAARGAPAKVIALDCDNTLWGGVVGEVGFDGIELGPDGPGRSFQLFQRQLKQLKERGLLLVVASRNEAHDVRRVFEEHPEMVLRPDDIAAWRVNWQHKSDNLREIARELNLGLDSFVFLDDDPVSRMEVKTRAPAVHVVPMPADPAAYCDTLRRLWLFDGAATTAVDEARTQMAKEEQRRQEERGSAASMDAFLAGLELHVEMGEARDADWPRVAQLTQRTNQFNLSLKRRTVEQMRALAGQATVVGLRARDRFGDYGQVGVCVLGPSSRPDTWEIDTLLMSCRALGRGVEDALMHGVAAIASEHGAARLVAPFVPGPRNAQIKDYLARCGFEHTGDNVWQRSLRELPPLPGHVRFDRRVAGGAVSRRCSHVEAEVR